MNEELQQVVEILLLEAGPAADSTLNGLLDRKDLEQVIARLDATVRQLTATCDQLKHERDAFSRCLNRSLIRQRESLAS